MDDKVQTLHPQGKQGVRISRSKYETMKETILDVLRTSAMTHSDLTAAVERRLKGKFEGSVGWHMESTKLDLEARGIIERVPGGKYEVYRVKR